MRHCAVEMIMIGCVTVRRGLTMVQIMDRLRQGHDDKLSNLDPRQEMFTSFVFL